MLQAEKTQSLTGTVTGDGGRKKRQCCQVLNFSKEDRNLLFKIFLIINKIQNKTKELQVASL